MEPSSPLKSVAGEAPEERGPAERRRKPGSPSKSPERTVARGENESTDTKTNGLFSSQDEPPKGKQKLHPINGRTKHN